jgi:hypothetical protein
MRIVLVSSFTLALVSNIAFAESPDDGDLSRAHALILASPLRVDVLRLVSSTTVAAPGPLPVVRGAPSPDAFAAYRASLDAVKRPEDHTPLFRFRHEKAAASKDAKCRYCHSGLSQSSRDACNDCHTVMRPKSHGVRFRSTEHGRLAALDQSRCATCHEVEYCTECHQIPPDNHYPIQNFSTRHERVARANPRSCLTCHTFEATCAECHTGSTAPMGTSSSPLRARHGGGR